MKDISKPWFNKAVMKISFAILGSILTTFTTIRASAVSCAHHAQRRHIRAHLLFLLFSEHSRSTGVLGEVGY